MPKILYVEKRFQASSLVLIDLANEIIEDYAAQGYDLTLRQLYYQMVSRDVIPNNQRSYDRLGAIINDARLAGMIDWLAITDRTRNLRKNSHWGRPEDILVSAANSFLTDKWRMQNHRPEVWVEKDALIGIVDSACTPLDVPYFACRGYTSQSEMWAAAQRIRKYVRDGYTPVIFHLGDHDPSGIDMTRDIEDRLKMFVGRYVHVDRLALNWDQIQQYNPPPNPAKLSDSRAEQYIENYGESSWELDALNPETITALITNAIGAIMDEDRWETAKEMEEEHRAKLLKSARYWKSIAKMLDKAPDKDNGEVGNHNRDGTSEYDFD